MKNRPQEWNEEQTTGMKWRTDHENEMKNRQRE
jgi:hypothetical protein